MISFSPSSSSPTFGALSLRQAMSVVACSVPDGEMRKNVGKRVLSLSVSAVALWEILKSKCRFYMG